MHNDDDRSDAIDVSSLTREVAPPRYLEDEIVGALVQRRLIASPRSRWSWLLAAATAAVMFGAGYAAASFRNGPVTTDTNQFALLLYQGTEFIEAPVDDPRQYARTYGAWGTGVAEQGALVNAGELVDGGWRLELDSTTGRVTLSDDATPAGTLSGFFIVRAPDADAALSLAETHPHLRNRGRIEVRQIVTR